MIHTSEKPTIHDAGGTIVYTVGDEVYYYAETRKAGDLKDGECFYHNGSVFQQVGDEHGSYLSGTQPGEQYLGLPPFEDETVHVIKPAEEIDTEARTRCKACDRVFSFRTDGVRYEKKAREHITKHHIQRGEPDEAVIDELLTREIGE